MVNKPLQEQINYLVDILQKNPYLKTILDSNPFPDDIRWYLGAGCICQSVWNFLSGKEITTGIKDYDLVYYDAGDISKDTETKEQRRIKTMFSSLPIDVEVINEARVHQWFEVDFGKRIDQFRSCENAIDDWPTTATAIGVNKMNGKINVYAPYGLNDLFGMVVRPNKPAVLKRVYEEKIEKWTKKWSNLKVIPWEQI